MITLLIDVEAIVISRPIIVETSFGADRVRNSLFQCSLNQSGINQGVTWKLVTWFSCKQTQKFEIVRPWQKMLAMRLIKMVWLEP